ncbi:MAG: hypothetical protein M1434_06795 [Chloroflexi bacterium]|nr:hypothetical protein [Chloroflexota bacterium]
MAHFDFELPGAVHGFHSHTPNVRVKNEAGHSASGARSLAIPFTTETRVTTATFIPHDAMKMQGYDLIASPTLYPGQTITATVSSDADAQVSLFVRAYGHNDELEVFSSAATVVPAKQNKTLEWTLTGIDGGSPIAEVGLDVRAEHGAGTLYLDTLNWDGVPNTVLTRPKHNGTLWQRAWVKACDDLGFNWGWVVRVCQDAGTGLLIQGVREWAGYTAQAAVVPHMAKSAGLAACVQGLRRYYALLLCDNQKARLVKVFAQLPGAKNERHILAEADFTWQMDGQYEFSLTTQGDRIVAAIDGKRLFEVTDSDHPLLSGAVGLVIEEGRLDCDGVTIKPA